MLSLRLITTTPSRLSIPKALKPSGSVVAGRGDGIVLDQLVTGIAAGVRRRQVAAGELLLQLLLTRHRWGDAA